MYCPHLFRNSGCAEVTFRSETKEKSIFLCVSLTYFVTLAAPKLLPFDNKNKKLHLLFCIVLTYS